MVESQPSKLLVAGSIPVSRSKHFAAGSRQPLAGGECCSTQRGTRVVSSASLTRARLTAGCPLPAAGSMRADVAQLAERVLGKDEVTSSILVIGSNLRSLRELQLASHAKVVRRSPEREGGPVVTIRE